MTKSRGHESFKKKAPGTVESNDWVGHRGPRIHEERRQRAFLCQTVILYSIIGKGGKMYTSAVWSHQFILSQNGQTES